MLVKVGEGDSKGPAFNQDPASYTNKYVVAKDKKVTVRDHGYYKEVAVESYTVMMHQTSYKVVSQSPPPFRQTSVNTWREGKQLQRQDNIKDDPEFLMEWWKTVISWKDLENQPLKHGEGVLYSAKAQRIYHALLLYEQLLNKNGESMKNNITELFSIADNLDKVSKGTKIAGITGGATSAVGGIAAVAGVVLSPFTFGASLALTAIGVGVATAGGVTGASAAIAHKVSVAQDRKKIETVLQDYRAHTDDLEACLKFINRGMGSLRMHSLTVLTGVHTKAVRVAKVVEVAGDTARAMDASSKASGMLNGFSLGMDLFYSNKDRQKLKKGLESKFAAKIRQVAGQLQYGLNELVKVKDMNKELLKE
ncbi:apolipoprotein L3-like isoform X2 [Hypomesus transpacificus]|nr:apolipoprotein L3-like isoform X2 [Hypomesus transpacificus]